MFQSSVDDDIIVLRLVAVCEFQSYSCGKPVYTFEYVLKISKRISLFQRFSQIFRRNRVKKEYQ